MLCYIYLKKTSDVTMVRSYNVIGCFKMPKRGAKVVPAPIGDGIFTIDMSSTSTLDAVVSTSLINNNILLLN